MPNRPLTILVHGCNASGGRFGALAEVFELHEQQSLCFRYNDRARITTVAQELRSAIDEVSKRMRDPQERLAWVVEQFDCTAGATCSSANGLASGRYSFTGYNLDNNTGPCVDSDANGSCDTFFSDFAFDDEVYEANYILSALGLPISLDGQALNSTWGAYEIGPTNGLTTGQLHDDGVEFAASASGAITAVATGGDYTSVEKAGRYYMKLYATTSKNALTGFRCLAPLDSATYTADALHPYSY